MHPHIYINIYTLIATVTVKYSRLVTPLLVYFVSFTVCVCVCDSVGLLLSVAEYSPLWHLVVSCILVHIHIYGVVRLLYLGTFTMVTTLVFVYMVVAIHFVSPYEEWTIRLMIIWYWWRLVVHRKSLMHVNISVTSPSRTALFSWRMMTCFWTWIVIKDCLCVNWFIWAIISSACVCVLPNNTN